MQLITKKLNFPHKIMLIISQLINTLVQGFAL